MKKLLCTLLALALAASLAPMALASGEPVTLQVSVFERGNTTNTYGSATDNYWTRWLQQGFGDPNNIKLEYVPIPRAEESAKLNTLMASGAAPDIIFSYDTRMIMNYGRDGGLTALTDLLPEYGQNLLANIAPALEYGVLNGEQYAIPAQRAKTGRYANFIRKDYLDAQGIELAVNEDGFYHMSIEDFEAILYNAKGVGESGLETYPLGMAGAYNATQAKPIIFAFVDGAQLTGEIAASTPQPLWPGYRDGVKFLNKLYNDGIMDPDFMIDTDTALPSFNTQVSTGRAIAFGQDDFYETGIVALYESDPNAEFVAFQLDNPYGTQVIPTYAPIGMYVAVPATSQHPEAAVSYLNYLADYDVCRVLAYGIEGVHYEMVDGSPANIEYTEEEKAVIEGYERITVGDLNLVYNGQPFGYATSLRGLTDAKARHTRLNDVASQLSRVGGVADYYWQGIVTEAEEMYDGFLANLNNGDGLPLLIACPAAEFDALWESTMNDYLSQGGQEVIDSKIELYRQLEGIN
ncbi:MAG: extracellular solute-binding protein [Oscillospiraceae bacterium]|nr:extracellular solute-binding protein [Oscillospiraceae bacterium]